MENNIKKRTVEEANYMILTNDTIRQIAKKFNISKSTVHKDLQDRLKQIDILLYKKIKKILTYHKKIRHIKGGEQTRKKYQNLHKKYTKINLTML